MELKEFISQALKDVIDGVLDAQDYGRGKGARVNPHDLPERDEKGAVHSRLYMRDQSRITSNLMLPLLPIQLKNQKVESALWKGCTRQKTRIVPRTTINPSAESNFQYPWFSRPRSAN